MALPYPTKVVLPFDIATAQDMNERHANDVALANGTGLDDGAVTPAKRSGGFYLVTHTFSTGTGTQDITGVPFRPKALIVIDSVISSGSGATTSSGAAVDGSPIQQFSKRITGAGTVQDDATFNAANSVGADPMIASVQSFNSDGVTVNVTTASNNSGVRQFSILFLS